MSIPIDPNQEVQSPRFWERPTRAELLDKIYDLQMAIVALAVFSAISMTINICLWIIWPK